MVIVVRGDFDSWGEKSYGCRCVKMAAHYEPHRHVLNDHYAQWMQVGWRDPPIHTGR